MDMSPKIAVRWVMSGFKSPREDVVKACRVVFNALIHEISNQKE